MVTDGGDEVIRSERLPGVPIYIVGVGTEPSTWDDLEISNTDIPEEVELDTPFKVSADIVVHSTSDEFAKKTAEVDAWIEKEVAGQYQQLQRRDGRPEKKQWAGGVRTSCRGDGRGLQLSAVGQGRGWRNDRAEQHA